MSVAATVLAARVSHHPEMVPWPTPPALSEVLSTPTANTSAPSASSLRAVTRTSATAAGERGTATALASSSSNVDHRQLSTRESELKQKIQALEDTIAEYERQKFNVMGTFAEYR